MSTAYKGVALVEMDGKEYIDKATSVTICVSDH